MVVDHYGLFILFNSKYLGSFYNVTILWKWNLYKNWGRFFVHTNKCFKYLLGGPSYLGGVMFVMWQLGRHELLPRHDQNVINAYNKMHDDYKVKVEQEIGGLKQKWNWLMKHFDSTKEKCSHSFCVAIILTNFLHKCHLHFTYDAIGDPIEYPTNY